jgi:hypothetical protein
MATTTTEFTLFDGILDDLREIDARLGTMDAITHRLAARSRLEDGLTDYGLVKEPVQSLWQELGALEGIVLKSKQRIEQQIAESKRDG